MTTLDSAQLLAELEPVVAENLDRHLATAKEWMPHEYVPWSQGRDFAVLGGEPWSAEQSQLSPIARTALEVNLLTEDNLPSYHREIDARFGRDGAWGTWVDRWTAEEGRHALLHPRLPARHPRRRPGRARAGPDGRRCRPATTPATSRCSTSAPTCRSRSSPPGSRTATPASSPRSPIAEKLLARIAKDENLHMIFYRNIVAGGAGARARARRCGRSPTRSSTSRCRARSSRASAARPCRSPRPASTTCASTTTTSSMPLLRQWGVFELEGLDAEGEQAREELAAAVSRARRRGHPVRRAPRGGGGEAGGAAERAHDTPGRLRLGSRPMPRRAATHRHAARAAGGAAHHRGRRNARRLRAPRPRAGLPADGRAVPLGDVRDECRRLRPDRPAHGLRRRARRRRTRLLRPFLGVGVLGGFTTFSTYAVQRPASWTPSSPRWPSSTCSARWSPRSWPWCWAPSWAARCWPCAAGRRTGPGPPLWVSADGLPAPLPRRRARRPRALPDRPRGRFPPRHGAAVGDA